MGWWSKDIMGGDTPLDAKDEIYGICRVEEFGEAGRQITREDIEANFPKILEMVRGSKNNSFYSDRAIYFQVLAVLMMRTGTPISAELKAEMLQNSATDEWAAEDKERKTIVDGLHTAIESYDGTPIVIRSKGLFEVMMDKLS